MKDAMTVQELRDALAQFHPLDRVAITLENTILDKDQQTVPLDRVCRTPSTYGYHVELMGRLEL